MLAESTGCDAFAALAAGRLDAGPWRIEATAEPVALRATRAGRPPLILIAGRQLVSRERLEVLALGLARPLSDGVPARETVAAAAAAGALAVLPWGLGKWTGRRRAVVLDLVARPPEGRLWAGDNGGRPALLPRPRLLARAEARGCPVLPGSDPLPLPAEVARAGSFGFVAATGLDAERPFAALKAWLQALPGSPAPYGRPLAPWTVVRRQLALRLARRR